ncbi:poly [ADP-ribose] polymerase 1 isoform X2 [Momordica charantia]|uniref:Poly [ADP-ribose] polymerase n=1 Tax=Momordica charantia TaxID=3673 RepID=A0A6J1CXV4_MOMCH|nr:poly [ADP-ribose] polymerase 1 isoform X2 [Momordica charantia]
MANPQKPWKVEYAKSSRSSCKTCKKPIDKENLRFGKMVQATQFDGFMPMWNHASCILKKAKQIKSVDDVEGLDSLRWEDQQKIRKYVEDSAAAAAVADTPVECGIEVAQASRAACKLCKQKIMKGEVRLSTALDGKGAKGLAWHHANCYMEQSPSTQVEKLAGWQSLPASDQAAVSALIKKLPSTENNEPRQAASKVGKRKKDATGDQDSKVTKAVGDVSVSRSMKTASDSPDSQNPSSLASKLEAQTKELWKLKDDLKKHVTNAELREMLESNGQDSTGSELDLRDRCADGMMFGALANCPICSASLRYSGGMYRCHGYQSAWSKCSYSAHEPERIKGKWKVPEETGNQYLCKWFKSQKVAKPIRLLPPPSSSNANGNQASNSRSQSSKAESLAELRVAFSGLKDSMEEWKRKIEGEGGAVHAKIKKDTNCLVVSGDVDEYNLETRKARKMKLPIVREEYLVECFRKQKKLPFDRYKVETTGESTSMVTVKVKGRSAVHESSGLQDTGHILEDKKSIYNTTLNMSDLSTGVNSYYILQIIQDDKSSDCHVFRKWGRVGNEKIGGVKLEEMSKSDAIREFKRLFLEKTGNPWEAWEQKQNFEKQPGRFFPLDIDYGVNKDMPKKQKNYSATKLAPQLAELMKMLFNVETYRNAMMEFEINMSEMPLGKLSRSNIQKGFEALTEIQNLLNSSIHDGSMKESLIIDASNRFFTVIPSIHPHIIRDEDDFKSKLKMLEALQDIEIASRLVGFDDDNNESLDEKYKKLRCDIAPISHESEDYKLIEKYLVTTHAPTHMDWGLELEEVFSLEREGEYDKFAPFRNKLENKMLLWHGSRLTNFVGILSQGLRIAPPEAPATGYMFGKGIYFADLVSKSAQYCYTDRKNPVGFMVLSEVALGEVYEVKKAEYMERPPRGKHSTKGMGKKVPAVSEHVKWREDVVVPCGKPVASNVKASELMYNEYIVYNTAQVKMQFLLKVRFHHKR